MTQCMGVNAAGEVVPINGPGAVDLDTIDSSSTIGVSSGVIAMGTLLFLWQF
jgi:hypothetical protein